MKRISLILVAVMLFTSVFMLSGCDTTISIDGNTTEPQTTNNEPETAVVEITNEEGTVISTETVTMSDDDKEVEKNFFSVEQKTDEKPGVSQDRLEQALQQNRPSSKPSKSDKEEKPDINDEEGDTSEDVYVQDDGAVLMSDQYMIEFTMKSADGKVDNYKIARKNKISSISFIYNNLPMTFIIGGDVWYWLSNDKKTYLKIPKSMIEESETDEEFKEMLFNDPLNFNRSVKEKGTEEIDGVEYDVVTYVDGTKDYFIGKTIIQTLGPDGSAMYYKSVSAVAPDSLFSPPSDYTEVSLQDEEVSEMVDSISPSTEESK